MKKMFEKDKDYVYTSGADIADSIGLIVICALVCLVVFL
jgi:hypothetical protein